MIVRVRVVLRSTVVLLRTTLTRTITLYEVYVDRCFPVQEMFQSSFFYFNSLGQKELNCKRILVVKQISQYRVRDCNKRITQIKKIKFLARMVVKHRNKNNDNNKIRIIK